MTFYLVFLMALHCVIARISPLLRMTEPRIAISRTEDQTELLCFRTSQIAVVTTVMDATDITIKGNTFISNIPDEMNQ